MVFWFELLTGRSGDVKHGERTGDVEEQCSESEVFAGTYPVKSEDPVLVGGHHQVTDAKSIPPA